VLHAPGHGEGGHRHEGCSHAGRLIGPDSLENAAGFGDRLDWPAREQQNKASHRFELISKIGVFDPLFGAPKHNFGLDGAAAIDPEKTQSPENRCSRPDSLVGGTFVESQEDIALLFPPLAEQSLGERKLGGDAPARVGGGPSEAFTQDGVEAPKGSPRPSDE
jgi:hypothetical protein